VAITRRDLLRGVATSVLVSPFVTRAIEGAGVETFPFVSAPAKGARLPIVYGTPRTFDYPMGMPPAPPQWSNMRSEITRVWSTYRVGILGMLNGFCGTIDDGPWTGCGPIAATYEGGKLVHFERTDRMPLNEPAELPAT
jgi:hypothetical protein